MNPMTYDSTFDQTRLDQLAAQCLATNTCEGKVIFLSDSDDNRLDVASWRFEDEDGKARLMKTEFKLYLMELLDSLLIYRARHGQLNASQGVVNICRDKMDLQWVSREKAESLRELNS